jgi:hypothetical protein
VSAVEGVPAHDEARFYNDLKNNYPDVQLLGPNCPGIITPGEIALTGGPVDSVSRSGALTYQALYEMTRQGIGQTSCVGIGGDLVPGTSFIDCLSRFQADPDTKAIIMIGEIGGSAEEEAAEYIQGKRHQADRLLHRGGHRVPRQEDGPRGRNHPAARAPRRPRPSARGRGCACRGQPGRDRSANDGGRRRPEVF